MQALLNMKVGAFVLSVIITALFSSVVLVAMYHTIPDDNKMLLILIGSLTTNFGTVVSFWMGSSASSRDKDDVIAKQADTANTNAAAAVKP